MMVGHALLAYAVVAALASRRWSRQRAATAGLIAGAFAAVPDADMVYALVGLAQADPTGVFDATGAFWAASTVAHRTVTHSVVLAVPAALAFAAWHRGGTVGRSIAVAVAAAIAALAGAVSGPVAALVVVAFVLAGFAVATVARRTDLSTGAVGVLALFGLVSHPWGDLFTGTPPDVFYPLPLTLFTGRISLAADPTLHLLGAFAVELLVVWAAIVVTYLLSGVRFERILGPHAGLGSAYGATALVLTPPTLDVSYHFVFSILAVGFVVAGLRFRSTVRQEETLRPDAQGAIRAFGDRLVSSVVTGVSAVTVAWAAYLLVYLWVL